jgi:hypothetical protein
MAIYKRRKETWWYAFTFAGLRVQGSTKASNQGRGGPNRSGPVYSSREG